MSDSQVLISLRSNDKVNFGGGKIHRFTDSRICVGWKNLHNKIIILYIIYLL